MAVATPSVMVTLSAVMVAVSAASVGGASGGGATGQNRVAVATGLASRPPAHRMAAAMACPGLTQTRSGIRITMKMIPPLQQQHTNAPVLMAPGDGVHPNKAIRCADDPAACGHKRIDRARLCGCGEF